MSTNLVVAACYHSRISNGMEENCMQQGYNNLLEPGARIKPEVDIKLAHQIAQKFYNLEVLDVTELNSYDDRNFLIKARVGHNDFQFRSQPDKPNNVHLFTLKVTNSLDSSCGDLIGKFISPF